VIHALLEYTTYLAGTLVHLIRYTYILIKQSQVKGCVKHTWLFDALL
jgi:hypothetical protein